MNAVSRPSSQVESTEGSLRASSVLDLNGLAKWVDSPGLDDGAHFWTLEGGFEEQQHRLDYLLASAKSIYVVDHQELREHEVAVKRKRQRRAVFYAIVASYGVITVLALLLALNVKGSESIASFLAGVVSAMLGVAFGLLTRRKVLSQRRERARERRLYESWMREVALNSTSPAKAARASTAPKPNHAA